MRLHKKDLVRIKNIQHTSGTTIELHGADILARGRRYGACAYMTEGEKFDSHKSIFDKDSA